MMGMMNFGYNGDWNNVPQYMQQMMQNYYGGIAPFSSIFGVMQFLTWVLVLILLFAAIRFLWNKGGNK